MKILHVLLTRNAFPVFGYGGTERVVWSLANAQQKSGHEVKFLMRPHKVRPDNVIKYNKKQPFDEQITDWPDIVHFHCAFNGKLSKPYLCTEHANADKKKSYARNTVFVSKKHAENHNAISYVYNGLNWDDYAQPNFSLNNTYAHFLGKATSKLKNLKGAAYIAKQAKTNLAVLGGNRFEFGKRGYINFDMNIKFQGMVGGVKKDHLIQQSKALVFPVLWHEPFGLAVTESLYLGTPVIATPNGSLQELIEDPRVGCLTNSLEIMIDALKNVEQFDRQVCHELAQDKYNERIMAKKYQHYYEDILNGHYLNDLEPFSNESLHQELRMDD